MLEIRKSEILEFAMLSELFLHELAFFSFFPKLNSKKVNFNSLKTNTVRCDQKPPNKPGGYARSMCYFYVACMLGNFA